MTPKQIGETASARSRVFGIGRSVRVSVLVGLVGLMASGCGGSTEPAQSPESPAPMDSAASSEPVAPASSDKVQAAIDAIQAKDFSTAKQILTEATQSSPRDPQAAFYLGVALEGLQDFEGAEKQYRGALDLDPKLTESSVNLSALLLDKQLFDESLAVVENGLKHAPKHPALLMNRALSLEGQQRMPEAAKAYAEAVEAAPENHTLRYAYAEVLLANKKKAEAVEQLKKVSTQENAQLATAVANLFGRLEAFPECIRVLDALIQAEPSADVYLRRGLCRHGMKDESGAKADFEAALKANADYAPGHYYLARFYKDQKDKKKALEHAEAASKLGSGTPLGKHADELIAELKKK